MDNKQLKKLSRRELLEILLEQSKEIDRLQIMLDKAQRKLEEREIIIANAGNIAQASLQLNDVFAAAQRAADQYLDSIRSMHDHMEAVMQNEICKTASVEMVPEESEPQADTEETTELQPEEIAAEQTEEVLTENETEESAETEETAPEQQTEISE